MADTFPRQYARTQRLTLGEPRTFTVSADGRRVAFVRSSRGDDPVNSLWLFDVDESTATLVADPRQLLAGDADRDQPDDLPAEERKRRERAREQASGIVSYATDPDVLVAAFALAGRLFVAGLVSARARELEVEGPVFDPRPDPTARRVAYVCGRALRIAELDGTSRALCADDDPDISWGSAEFIAAEEMGRMRGYWWSPDGERLAVARVDSRPVQRWHVADLARPENEPTTLAYPKAGSPNAEVSLYIVSLDGTMVEVGWDRHEFPYLVDVHWPVHAPLTIVVQTRDQRRLVVHTVDAETGRTTSVFEAADPTWVDIVPGVPRWLADGRLVTVADQDDARRLVVAGEPVTEPTLQVRSVTAVTPEHVVFTANEMDEPTELHVLRWSDAGIERLTSVAGVHQAAAGGATVVVTSATLTDDGTRTVVTDRGSANVETAIASYAERALVTPAPTLARVGSRRLATAVLLPSGDDSDGKLPVLLDPYGGPHAQRVVSSRQAYLSSQWLADQGFAVVVIDGRGTPGRGAAWERAVAGDLATAVLDDQVDGLLALAEVQPRLDLTRVAIRGWSFGGYLAALAVLRRPDVFRAAIAGAPVTDWRLYDTHYTERYLGDPEADPAPYERSSLLTDAARLERPLLLIHGLADDNVVAAHTLQFSSALLAAGRPHSVLPLSGVTHMTPQEVVAENLLLLQVAFLQQALGSG